jgi:hypothetical protein
MIMVSREELTGVIVCAFPRAASSRSVAAT